MQEIQKIGLAFFMKSWKFLFWVEIWSMKKTLKLKIWNIKEYVNYTTTNKQPIFVF